MSQIVRVVKTDDLDGTEGAETLLFGLDGQHYEMELTAKHADDLRGTLRRYVDAGRPVTVNGRAPRARARRPRTSPGAIAFVAANSADGVERRALIRAWSLTDAWPGEAASVRGRLAGPLIAAYDAAHGGTR